MDRPKTTYYMDNLIYGKEINSPGRKNFKIFSMELLQEEALATIGEAHAETVCGVAELSE